ncbi:MAG: DUF4893 domain-containing protein [Beijerinckiaceae bacterium]
MARAATAMAAAALAAALSAACGPVALAQPRTVTTAKAVTPLDALTATDRHRLTRMEASRTRALAAAADGDASVYKLALSILNAPAQRINTARLQGEWRCRTFSLGGRLGPKFAASKTAYFRCRILEEGNGFTLRKLSGSMSWLGRLRLLGPDRMLYYGTAIARGDKQPIYPEIVRFGAHYAGILQQIGPGRLRMELPEPVHSSQSFHDLVELVK